MKEYIDFEEQLLNNGQNVAAPTKNRANQSNKNIHTSTNNVGFKDTNQYQTYSEGIFTALDDSNKIRWKTFFISIPFGLFPWLLGLLGINSVPQKYIEKNCSLEFIKGYKSKKKRLKFLPSFICWISFTNIFYYFIFFMLIN
jgi:hypothetical protein